MNPYASHLGNRDPRHVIAATAGELERHISTLGPQRSDQSPAPGKWSAREIVCHLADCELVFAFRLRQALAQDHHVIQPFDQDQWARNYAAYDTQSALRAFAAMRQWNLALIKSLPQEAFAKRLTHPERGEMTLQTVVETMGGHDLNHLKQIESIATRAAKA
jgi:uncharacterized damage-inducible protein DinB